MANSITGFTTFVRRTTILSAAVNANFEALKNSSPLWQKYTVPFSSFVALGATATGAVTLYSITAAEVVDAHIVKHSAIFAGTSITAAVVRVGKTGSDGYYADDFDVAQAVSGSAVQLSQGLLCDFSSTSVLVTLSLTGGLLSQLSTGSIDIYVRKATLP